MTVEYRYAKFHEYHRISKFLDEYWAKDHVYVRMPQLFEWTFGRKSLWEREEYSFTLAEDKGEIVGILGGIPFIFNCLGKASQAIWPVNYMVRPDYRRELIALRLLSMFRRAPYEATVSFGINPRTVPIYQLLRWQVLEEIPRHFVVLPDVVGRMVNLLQLAHPAWQVDRAEALACRFRLVELPQVSVKCTETLSPSWDDYDWPQIASRTVGAVRDLNYLTWRYIRHPCFTYRLLTVPDGERTGLAVWRLETIRCATAHGLEEVDRIGRLVEFLPVSRHNAQALLALFWQALRTADALGADYYGYHGRIGTWLRELGFHGVESHPDGPAIPARFQPLENKGGGILSAIFVQDDVPQCAVDPHCVWYWTKSDADQDRPN